MKHAILTLPALALLLSACQTNVTVKPAPTPTPAATPTPQPSPTASVDPTLSFSGNFDVLPSGTAGENENTAMFNNLSLTADRFNRPNQAYRFSGDKSYLRINYDINPSVLPRASMSIWARFENPDDLNNGTHTVISHDNEGYDRTIAIDGRSGEWGWSAFAGSQDVIGAGKVVPNTWVMLTAVYDQPAKTVALYLNNQLVKSVSNATLGEGNKYLLLGKNPGFGEHFKGTLDDLRIYNRALSQAEVQILYTATKP